MSIYILFLQLLVMLHLSAVSGSWSQWDDWSACSEQCGGGTQLRFRFCDSTPPTGCPGSSHDTQTCNTFICPDCSAPCPVGCTMSVTVCGVCEGNTDVSGTVFDGTTGLPLSRVEAYTPANRLVSLGETSVTGRFLLTDMCASDLDLYFIKPGYTSKEKLYAYEGQNMAAEMCENYITFTTHPQSVALFAGDKLTLTCKAEGLPNITHYDWFKDSNLIRDGEKTPGDSSTFTIAAVTGADCGRYQCRAVSYAMKKFSLSADVSITVDSCDETPSVRMFYLGSCTAVIRGEVVTSVDIGACSGTACTFSDRSRDSEGMCCEMKTSDEILVNCHTFTYPISQILSCGCAECADDNTVTVSGAVRFVGRDGAKPPGKKLKFYVGTSSHFTKEDGSFSLVTSTNADTLVLQFRGDLQEGYAPNLMTVRLQPEINGYEVLVLLKLMLTAVDLDPSQVHVLTYGDSAGMSAMAEVTIPANSMILLTGELLDSTNVVSAYLTFSDPRLDTGLSLAPGEFTTTDGDGILRNLVTGGVFGLHLILKDTGETVILLGEVNVEVSEDQEADGLSSWRLHPSTGTWYDPVIFQDEGATLSAVTSFSSGSIKAVNIDYIDTNARCWAKVFVSINSDGKIPAPNVRICAYSRDINTTTEVAKTVTFTGVDGKACIQIPCGKEHEILVTNVNDYTTSDAHKLPEGFTFSNILNRRVSFTSPAISDSSVTSGDGPVHSSQSACHSANGWDYHFKFFFSNHPKPGHLIPTEPRPGLPDSWYPEPMASPERTACMVRVRIDSHDSSLEAVASSHRGDDDGGFNYGVYDTGFLKYYDVEEASYDPEHQFACVEVKCPGLALDNETVPIPQNDPAVFVRINIKHPAEATCGFVSYGDSDSPFLTSLSETDSGVSFLMDPEKCSVCDAESEDYDYDACFTAESESPINCGDQRVFVGTGVGRAAGNDALDKCYSSDAPYYARFQCT